MRSLHSQFLRRPVFALVLLAGVLGLTGCPKEQPGNSNQPPTNSNQQKKDFLWEVKRDGAAVAISINKSIKGLSVLDKNKLITPQQEKAGLEYLDTINDPLLAVGKKLEGIKPSEWPGVKGDVLKTIDDALAQLDKASNLVFKSEKARAEFQVWITTIRAGLTTLRITVEAVKSV